MILHWFQFFIQNNQEILVDLNDFAFQEQSQDKLMVAIFLAWYNGSYTMAAKPINDPVFNTNGYQ